MGKDYSNLSFADDFIFCKILTSKPELCKELLSIILKKDVKKITFPEGQKSIKKTKDGKGVRLDVYVEDENTSYDIEMQTTIDKNLPKRARYYQGMIDSELLKKGKDYKELKASYVIFICLSDPFNKNASVYTMQNRCDEFNDLCLEDETYKIFLNANGNSENVSEDMKKFLKYVATGQVSGRFTEALDKEVQKAKNKEEWRAEYMTLEMKYKEKFDEGKIEGKVEVLADMVKDNLISIAEAAKRSGLTETEFSLKMQEASK